MQLLNSAHVYKRHSFISKDECVRIPEVNIKHDVIDHMVTPIDEEASVNTFLDPIDETGINQKSTGLNNEASINFGVGLNEAEGDKQNSQSEDSKDQARDTNAKVNAPEINATVDKRVLSAIYKKELEELSQAAAESAYFDALNKKKRELKECIIDVQKIMDELVVRHEEFIEQYTNELKYIAVDIAEKMLLEKINMDDAILKRLVLQNLKNVKTAEWINVELSERLVGLVDSIKKELETEGFNGRVGVSAVAEKEDTCRVTTEDGTVVSTISVQADNLRRAFKEADKE